MNRKCSRCKSVKDDGLFVRSNQNKSGYSSWCKACKGDQQRERIAKPGEKVKQAARVKSWRLRNRNHANKWAAEWRAKNPDKFLAAKAKYRQTERGRMKERAWVESNRKALRSATRRWKDRNPKKCRAIHSLKRARKRAATIIPISSADVMLRMSVFGFRCAYCPGPFEEIDHLKPLSKGGPHCLANLRPSCMKCNRTKHAMGAREWLNRIQPQ